MGILQKIRSAGSPESRLLNNLAELGGRGQALCDRLRRHAEQCTYPVMKSELESIAAKEAQHVKILNGILADHARWAKLVEVPIREGANNWERISNDLALLNDIHLALSREAIHWEAVDPSVSDKIRAVADEDNGLVSELRKLALKSDPQALD